MYTRPLENHFITIFYGYLCTLWSLKNKNSYYFRRQVEERPGNKLIDGVVSLYFHA